MASANALGSSGATRELLAPPIATFATRRRIELPRWVLLLALVLGQAFMANVMSGQRIVSQMHGMCVIGVLFFALLKRNTPLLLTTFAYLPGAEIMWRQSRTPFLASQASTYLFIACSAVAIATTYPHINRAGRLALLYIGMLLPSMVITLSITGIETRETVVFALAGPTTLAMLVVFFSQLTITNDLYRRLLWAIVISGVGPLTIALSVINDYIGAGRSLDFGTGSNAAASGGFGPVQVSSLLGFTVLAAFLLFMIERELIPRVMIFVIGIASMAQSLLTFSRGGMFATAIALGGLIIAHAGTRRGRVKTFATVLALLSISYFIVIPRIDTFTQGKFEERFRSTQSGRTTLAASDLDLFRRNALFGVGPGMARYREISFEECKLRSDSCAQQGSSHTEFTRMPAEHGLSGVFAIAVMAALALEALRRAGPSFSISLTMLLWAVAQMFYANLRVAAVPFAFAFAFLRIRETAGDRIDRPPDVDAQPPPSRSRYRAATPASSPAHVHPARS